MVRSIRTTALSIISLAALLMTSNVHAIVVDDFDSTPGSNFFAFSQSGTTTFNTTTTDSAGIANVPGQASNDPVLEFTIQDTLFAGIGNQFFDNSGTGYAGSQDWSGSEALSFWFYGNGTSNNLFVSLLDTNSSNAGELWRSDFSDDFVGWQEISISFDDFYFANYSSFNNGSLDLDTIYSWVIGADQGVTGATYYVEDLTLTPVPSPSTFSLALLGLVLVTALRKK